MNRKVFSSFMQSLYTDAQNGEHGDALRRMSYALENQRLTDDQRNKIIQLFEFIREGFKNIISIKEKHQGPLFDNLNKNE